MKDSLSLTEVYLGHLYVYRGNGKEFSFHILGATPEDGVFVRASRPKMVAEFPGGPKSLSSEYWIRSPGRLEARTDGMAFVFDDAL